ncbi:cutinase family protein [Corynebacterium mendelii]|uniref:Cutinase family protein n=1 Tax=Corynebacterium mendelii TaxID=2765362 RepID=A0A939IXL4_9CORY|nr:cutinase family protein [Corynebacterium mendelii]MBN9644183.1 cutinase family protein [Corynebacterium mendelii]
MRFRLLPPVRRLAAAAAACVFAVGGLAGPGSLPRAQAQPAECPATVIIAARGSGEPQAATMAFPVGGATTNGWEGGMIQRTLEHFDLTDTTVIGLDADDYEAATVWLGSGSEVYESSVNGARNAIGRALDFERRTGCRPSYIVMGYSQGAAVMHMAEIPLSWSGRLVGAIYMGDPFLTPGDPALIGAPSGGRGMVYYGGNGLTSTQLRAAPIVADYCLPRDPVCDWPGNVDAANDNYGNHIIYFRPRPHGLTPSEQEVVNRANAMLNLGRQRKADGANNTSPTPVQWSWIAGR